MFAAAAIVLASCSVKEVEPVEPEAELDNNPVVTRFVATVQDFDMPGSLGTKANLSGSNAFTWEAGDMVSMWPSSDDLVGDAQQVMFRAESGGSNTTTFKGDGWGMLRGVTYYSSFPYDANSTSTSVYLCWKDQRQIGDNGTSHLGEYTFLHAVHEVPASGEPDITFQKIGAFAQFVISIPTEYQDKTFTHFLLWDTEAESFMEEAYYDPSQATVTLTGDKTDQLLVYLDGDGDVPGINATDGTLTVNMLMAPAAFLGHEVKAVLLDTNEEPFIMNIVPIANQEMGKGYRYSADVPPPPSAIDLGLSVKWASYNLGAGAPEEYGGHYAWGETKTKSDYRYQYYDWKASDNSYKYGKYVVLPFDGTVDGKALLEPGDDAAQAAWGDKWRMPTEEEFEELLENCTATPTTVNGVNGYQFTSTVQGYENASIFLPYGGQYIMSSLSSVTSCGMYLSSTLAVYTGSNGGNNPAIMCISSDQCQMKVEHDRYYGYSVRPVYGDIVPATSITIPTSRVVVTDGNPQQLTAIVSPANCSTKRIVWSSSNDYFRVNDQGIVSTTFSGNLSATITATWAGDSNVFATCEVTTIPLDLPTGFDFNGKLAQVSVGLNNVREIDFVTGVSGNGSGSSGRDGSGSSGRDGSPLQIGADIYMSYSAGVVTVSTSASKFIANPDCARMFANCTNLTTITGLVNFDTSEVTTMGDMFYDCEHLESLDLSSFDTRNVTIMGYMFEHCYALRELELGENFIITEECHNTNCDEMFLGDNLTIYGHSATAESFEQYLDVGNAADRPHDGIHFAVDMGEAGWWSVWNVGADTSLEPGLFFSWGNNTGHWLNGVDDGYVFSSANYATTPGSSLATDWHTAPIGDTSRWRMPTKSDFETLTSRTVFDQHGQGSEMSFSFTCRSTGNTITIPYPNFIEESGFGVNLYGLWTATKDNTDSDRAYFNGLNWQGNRDYKHNGRNIRLVAKRGTNYVTSLTLSSTVLTLALGQSSFITPNIMPARNAFSPEIVWTSSDTSVATVVVESGNTAATVTAVSPGTAVITATNVASGISATCNVTVDSRR